MPEQPTARARIEITREEAEARAARNVPHNPNELCRSFSPKPSPSAFWCITCGWNEPMHEDDVRRTAIAAELQRFNAARTAPDAPLTAVTTP